MELSGHTETKRCGGAYGEHYCVSTGAYSTPMLPVSAFYEENPGAEEYKGYKGSCKICLGEVTKRRMPKINSISSLAYKKAGGSKEFYLLPKVERLRLRAEASVMVYASQPRNIRTLYLEESLPKIYKEIKRQPPKQQKVDYPPEGYVYIFRNRWHPEGVYKIGSTDNLQDRRSAARTWGPYDCEFYLEVQDCKLVESMVHEMMRDYRIEAGDLGKEHFSIDLEKATSIIKNVAFELACMHKDCAA